MAKVLLVDDEKAIRRVVNIHLKRFGYEVVTCKNGQEGLRALHDQDFDLIVTDLQMPKLNGIEFLTKIKEKHIRTPVIVLTVVDNVEKAVEAIKLGAADYITKPPRLEEITHRIEKILAQQSLIEENHRLKKALRGNFKLGNIVGKSRAMMRVFEQLKPLANDGNISILIVGESGTGKELTANAIHYNSPRAEGAFVAINCAALPENLLESELYGHEKGAFTGADKRKRGLFEIANGGTLFLDEISSMPLEMQAKLLRAIEERQIRPVGGTESVDLDLRIIAASNQNLEEMVREQKFRQDLYYRLAVATVELPPLRDRNGDVALLAIHFLDKFGREKDRKIGIDPEAMTRLKNYSWEGNIRELENLIRLLVVTTSSDQITLSDLPPKLMNSSSSKRPGLDSDGICTDLKAATKSIVSDFETKMITEQLQNNSWNISKTAVAIGISRVALHAKINEYQISIEN